MKSIVETLLFVTLVLVMTYTNPTIDDYSYFIREQIVHETKSQDDLSQALGVLLGGVGGSVVANATTRNNYVLFSIYKSDFNKRHLRFIGIFGNFIPFQ